MVDLDAETADRLMQVFNLGQRLKVALKEKGKRRGWTKCPRCGGKVIAVLAGKRDHLHMGCQTPGCDVRMME